ncbi:MAG: thiamine-phosphate kinase, partial [Chthoniobacteraceae bacterium]
DLYRGLATAARRFEVTIVGGETARSPGPLFLSIALTGEVERGRCVLRSGGKPGDALYVTGRLGGSRAGHHLDFIPRVVEARWLTENFRLHAMMDLSDGLASDLPRLARASRCGFALDLPSIPRTRGCTLEQAMRDGEDYELLLALPNRRGNELEAAWFRKFPNLNLTRIGRLADPSPTKPALKTRGFDHFA